MPTSQAAELSHVLCLQLVPQRNIRQTELCPLFSPRQWI